MHRILIIDDDPETCRFMTELLQAPDREIASAHDPDDAIATLRGAAFDLVVSDINLNATQSGLDLLRVCKQQNPRTEVLLISGFGTLDTAIKAVRAGVFDYISKPFDISAVKRTVERALAHADAGHGDVLAPTPEIQPAALIGRTAAMLDVYKQIAHAADSAAPVLIIGESGTGKELVARAVHSNSRRVARPFVAVNCGAIPETLLESQVFGHARGAFTGAVADAKGLLEQANEGTVFLDEIGATSPALQVKLLRVLEDHELRPVGASRTVRLDVRVIAATNVDLEREAAAQRFRQDLYYRLSVIVIRMPPLRERRADIPLLVDHFLQNARSRAGRHVLLASDALDVLTRHDWPGNVRELENTIERLVLFSRGSIIDDADLPPALQQPRAGAAPPLFDGLPTLDELERRYLVHVLGALGGNRTKAAEVMGIDRRTLYRMAERLGVDLKE